MEPIYTPLIVLFTVFVIYGGLVIPVREITESIRDRRSRGPSEPDAGPGAEGVEVVELRSAGESRRAAA
ncbi:hypothetical protein [Actinomadura opuntiae]|uniref:hypothetical protein n=1 Tax=Actinomadura sp. OS1-43 TaxID=604315 RepID=UPI00255A96F6|nr:hypothetical protein [Actinomadura sp. OS1-43]MDL4817874.1 hypothetical protein [Actinomadura sp. OS1-43]